MKNLFSLLLITVTFMATAQVANDDCINATTLQINPNLIQTLKTPGTVANATASPEANTCGGGADDDVWFQFTATSTIHQINLLNLVGISYDLNHVVYEGSDCGTLIQKYCSDPNMSTAAGLTIGQTYKIRIYTSATLPGQNTTFNVCITTPPTPPTNDECNGASIITVSAPGESIPLNGTLANSSLMNTAVNICTDTTKKDVWYEFTATSEEHLIILRNNTSGASIAMALYNSCTSDVLMCNSVMPFAENLVIGQNYKIRVYATNNLTQSLNANFSIRVLTPQDPVSITQPTPEEMIASLLPQQSCNLVTNFNAVTGTDFNYFNGIGLFDKNGTSFPFNTGLVLSSGDLTRSPWAPSGGSAATGWPGDTDMNTIMANTGGAGTSYNATILEFDFTPIQNHISLEYLFASNEYGSFQCNFGDAIAILLTDLTTGTTKNIATVPNTNTAVATTSVRDNANNLGCVSVNPEYFGNYYEYDNTLKPVAYNGITVPLTAQSEVTAFSNYHLKIVVADRADTLYDSAIFINAESLNLGTFNPVLEIAASNGTVICDGESTTLNIDADEAYTIEWAFNGVAVTDTDTTSFTASVPGEYTVTVSHPAISCTASASIVVTGGSGIPAEFEVTDYTIIDTDNDGFASFDLAVKTTETNALLTGSYILSYYENLADAENETNALQSVYSNTLNPQTLFARIENSENGCAAIKTFILSVIDLIVPAPTGDNDQYYDEGETLANLEVEGENIQWYDNNGEIPDFPDGTGLPLPITTPLTDGTTYYASQTINGIESTQRLAVTAHLILGNEDVIFEGLRYYPNPATTILNIENTNGIDTVSIANALGQVVMRQAINNSNAQVDVSSLSKGVYFVTVTSGSAAKVIKIIKE